MYIKSDVDLDLTLVRSAQAFQWYFDGREYVGHAGGHEALIIPGDDGFEIISPCTDEAFWRDYFDLGRDYAALKPICDADPYLKQSYDALHGLHVLNQPVWDTLPSFIISANNNVARIRVLVKKLCDELGERRELNGIEIHLFPTPEALAAAPVETLRAMGMGYRAPYLIESAQAVVDGFDLNQLRTLPYEQAHKKILQLKGVGPKVADCVLLFGLGHTDAFPVDVWIGRALSEIYFGGEKARRQETERAIRALGSESGIVQQYIFHYARQNAIGKKQNAKKIGKKGETVVDTGAALC